MWQPEGANAGNMAAMVADPADLVRGRPAKAWHRDPARGRAAAVARCPQAARAPAPRPRPGRSRPRRSRRRLMPDDLRPANAPRPPRRASPGTTVRRRSPSSRIRRAKTALRDGLADLLPALEIRRGGVRAAIAAQQRSPNPRILIVDVSGEDHPLAALGELSERGRAGYLRARHRRRERPRALSRDHARAGRRGIPAEAADARHRPAPFRPARAAARPARPIAAAAAGSSPSRARAAASAPASSPRASPGISARRRIATRCCSIPTCIAAPPRCCSTPSRAKGCAPRSKRPIASTRCSPNAPRSRLPERLHVLSALEPLTRPVEYVPGAAEHLLEALRRRYNVVLADVPCHSGPFCRDMLDRRASPRGGHDADAALGARRAASARAHRSQPARARRPRWCSTGSACRARSSGTRSRTPCALPVDIAIPDCRGRSSQAVTMGAARDRRAWLRGAVANLAGQIGALRQPGAGGGGARPAARLARAVRPSMSSHSEGDLRPPSGRPARRAGHGAGGREAATAANPPPPQSIARAARALPGAARACRGGRACRPIGLPPRWSG